MPLLLCCTQLIVSAQQKPPLTMPEAVQRALDKYPAVRSSLEQVSAAAAGINLARTSYLPRADFLGQVNRATRRWCINPNGGQTGALDCFLYRTRCESGVP